MARKINEMKITFPFIQLPIIPTVFKRNNSLDVDFITCVPPAVCFVNYSCSTDQTGQHV